MAEEIEVAGLVTRLSIDDTDLSKSLASLDRQMKLVQSEFNKAASGLTNFGKSEETLRVRSDALGKQLEIQAVRVAKLNEQYRKSVEEKGADARATQKLQTDLNKAIASYNKLDAELAQTNKELAEQTDAWLKLSKTLESAGKNMQAAGKRMSDVGKSLTATVTAPLVAVGGLVAKTSIDFETAFAGVRKTIEATEPEFAALGSSIRDMAKEIPATATEIARVAESAGQLGIQKGAIIDFTRTMIDLGNTTNLSSDQAATSLARLANITQLPQDQFDRLGATIVALGNNLATTEAEIVEMGLRIAGAGEQIGLTEAQILGFSGALSSVGIEAEAGGSAISRVFIDIAQAVATGNENLELFAKVAGMSAADFRQSFQQDAAGAVLSFIEGLGRLSKSGQNTFGVLEELGLSEIRVRDALLRASNAGDLFRDSLELGSKAWQENTALTNEAAQRYETSASKLQILRNRMTDVGITLGNALVPALLDALDAMEPLFRAIEDAVSAFAAMDKSSQQAILILAGIAAAVGPLLIILGKLVTAIGAITTAIGNVNKAMAAARLSAAAAGTSFAAMAAPIAIAIAAIAALVAAGVLLYRHFSKDAIPAVQDFGDEADAAAKRASGSFAKFRQDTKGALEQTAATAKSEGAKIGENLATGVSTGTKKAREAAIRDMREMVDRMKETVDRSSSSLNRLGDAIADALKKQYEEAERIQSDALGRQVEAEKRASEERMRLYDKEFAEKLKLIDEEAYNQVKALQDQIDAIDKQTEAEEKAKREQEYLDRVAEYRRQLAAAETAEERERIQRELTRTITDHERQQMLEQRKLQKDVLKEQIEAVKAAAEDRKKELRQEVEDKKQAESDKLKAVIASLDDEKEAVKAHFDALKSAESVQAEARKLIIEQNNDEIVQLLETYNPKWQDAGQSFADSFINGLNSEKQSIQDAVANLVNLAPNIDDQVAELDRLQAKLSELEEAAREAGSAGGGSLGIDFESAIAQSEELAQVVNEDLTPAIEGVGAAASGMREEALKAFLGLHYDVTTELYRIKFSGETITEETAASIADKFFAMGSTITENLEAAHAEQLESLRAFFADSNALTSEEEEKALEKLRTHQANEASEIEASQTRIAEILSTALEERRGITQREYDEINRIQSEMLGAAERTLGGHELAQKTILERMRADAEFITARQAADVVKQSIRQRDEAIQAAEEQYNRVIAEIIRQRDEAKTISKEQADALIADAKRQRDESVESAKSMHRNVIREARELAAEFKFQIDWSTGEVLNRFAAFENEWKTKWLQLRIDFAKWVSDVFGEIVDNWKIVETYLKRIDLRQIGSDIMSGLMSGITSKISEMRQRFTDFATDLPDWVKGPLGIQSPSRVMMQIGEFTGEGFAIGMGRTIDTIRRQAAAMVSAVTPGTTGASAASAPVVRSAPSATTTVTFNMERLFEGATFVVRSDSDAELIAREIYNLSASRAQSEGVME